MVVSNLVFLIILVWSTVLIGFGYAINVFFTNSKFEKLENIIDEKNKKIDIFISEINELERNYNDLSEKYYNLKNEIEESDNCDKKTNDIYRTAKGLLSYKKFIRE